MKINVLKKYYSNTNGVIENFFNEDGLFCFYSEDYFGIDAEDYFEDSIDSLVSFREKNIGNIVYYTIVNDNLYRCDKNDEGAFITIASSAILDIDEFTLNEQESFKGYVRTIFQYQSEGFILELQKISAELPEFNFNNLLNVLVDDLNKESIEFYNNLTIYQIIKEVYNEQRKILIEKIINKFKKDKLNNKQSVIENNSIIYKETDDFLGFIDGDDNIKLFFDIENKLKKSSWITNNQWNKSLIDISRLFEYLCYKSIVLKQYHNSFDSGGTVRTKAINSLAKRYNKQLKKDQISYGKLFISVQKQQKWFRFIENNIL